MFFKTENQKQKNDENSIIDNRFMIKMPSQWKDITCHTFDGPEEDGIKHNILLTIEKDIKFINISQYAEMKINTIAAELKGYTELKKGPFKLQNNISAYEVIYKWCPIKEREIYQKVVYIINNSTGYTILTSFSKKTFKIRGAEVNKIIMSFQPSV